MENESHPQEPGRAADGHPVPRSALRLGGGVLLLLVVLPVYRFARPGAPGSPTEHLTSLAASYYGAQVMGGVAVALVVTLLGFTGIPRRVGRLIGGVGKSMLLLPRPWPFALVAGAISGLFALFLSAYGFSLRPALLDATSQLIHARYLAAGHWAGPELALPEFFATQFMVALPTGWASQYPPGHLVMLASGIAAGAPWAVGPALVMATVVLTARLAETLLPGDIAAARLGTLFLGSSLFFLGHAATFMSHATAATFGVLTVLAGVRGREEGGRARAWAVIAGLAAGAVFATRPLAGLVSGAVALVALYPPHGVASAAARRLRWLRRLPWFAVGGLPPVLALAVFNQRLFGSPARFGYIAAEGPGHGLGFHRDPWGNPYGPLDGLVQTSRDLLALGLDLLVTPVSAVMLVAAYLLLGPTRPRALFLLLLWALLPVVGHFFYWHQDLFMGPRLLTEFTPPWAILTALAMLELVRRTRGNGAWDGRRFDPHGALVGALVLTGVAAVALLIPQRVALYHAQWGQEARVPVPRLDEPALVFVQGSWSERLGARLAASGMRVDSIRAALRYNTSCEVQRFLDAREAGTAGSLASAGGLHFGPRPEVQITAARLNASAIVWTHPGERPAPECVRQAEADLRGSLELPELLWQGDLPGLPRRGPMFVRDLGPELNRRLMALYADRRPLVYLRPEPQEAPVLQPYSEGMGLLWKDADRVRN